MKPKFKALVFNFIGFAFIFLIFRLSIGYFFEFNRILMALVSALAATILAPKFVAVRSSKTQKIFMKWIFIKGIREL
jgi:hypothetical protein